MRALVVTGCVALLTIAAPLSGQANNSPNTPSVANDTVQPEAVAALQRMSRYLSALNSFALTSNSTLDIVAENGQRVQMEAVVNYKVRRPGIRIDFNGTLRDRQYFYDGKTFTIYAPRLDLYASAPAPSTNKEFLKAIYDQYGISLPLEDLFRWSDGDRSDLDALTSGFSMGTATIDGVPTDHWAYRQGDFDWEIWIEQGDRPLPRKLVIIDRTVPALPAYAARLNWTPNAPVTAQDFTYAPGEAAMRIPLATLTEAAK